MDIAPNKFIENRHTGQEIDILQRVIWITGLSGAGKSTIARTLQEKFLENNV